MPMADLKKDDTLVRFKWSWHKDIVTIYGFDSAWDVDPLQITKLKKTGAQGLWRKLVRMGYKHLGTYENGVQIK